MNNKSMADYSTVPEYYIKSVLDYSGSKYNVECIDVINTMCTDSDGYEGFCIGNIIKYLFRFHDKNGIDDLRKALKYMNMLVDYSDIKEINNNYNTRDVNETK